ncbi:MAG: RidA family protein [Chloroflexi bacterium]|nr:RidA family protein [Chloroflexota bacterium]
MNTQVIATPNAPAAIGPYSQGKTVGGFIFTAGQIPLDPKDASKPFPPTIQEQTHRVFQNLAAILEAAGSDLEHVVKTTVFMTDLSEFAAMNEVYAQYFKQQPPARSTVQVSALPRGARVEIEAIAVARGG